MEMITIKRIETIKDKKIFNNVIKTSPYKKNNYYVIYYKDKEEIHTQIGIAISTKYGKAYERNRIKRQTRNIIDEYKNLFSNTKYYIIMIKKTCKDSSYEVLKKSLYELIKEIP